MAEATLAIRPTETIYLWDRPFSPVWIGEHQYQVALLQSPPLPEPHHWPDEQPLALVAIQKYTAKGETKWGWIAITPESKAEIGHAMEDAGMEAGRWYWLLVSPLDDRPMAAKEASESVDQKEGEK